MMPKQNQQSVPVLTSERVAEWLEKLRPSQGNQETTWGKLADELDAKDELQRHVILFAEAWLAVQPLLELAKGLPKDLRVDWRGRNCYKLTDPLAETGYWWLDLFSSCLNFDTEDGKRLGLVLNIAAAVAKLRDGLEKEQK